MRFWHGNKNRSSGDVATWRGSSGIHSYNEFMGTGTSYRVGKER